MSAERKAVARRLEDLKAPPGNRLEALRLGKYFGVSPEIWLDLQSDYDLRVARMTDWPKIEPRIRERAA